jgi:hypothetical protein
MKIKMREKCNFNFFAAAAAVVGFAAIKSNALRPARKEWNNKTNNNNKNIKK